MTLVLAFVITGAFAQVVNSDAVEGGNVGVNADEGIDSLVIGAVAPYWAEPDSYYHPDYDAAAPAWALTAGFTWNWSIPLNPGAGAAITGGGAPANYVEITFSAAGLYQIAVNEQAPAAMGSCQGSDTTMYVRVITTPTVTFTGDDDGNGILGIDISACEGGARTEDVVQATFSNDKATYQLDWDLVIRTLDGTSTPDEWFNFDKSSAGAALAYARDFDGAAGTQVTGITGSTHDLDKPVGGWTVINNKVTEYIYTISAVNGRISRKSDYLTNSAQDAASWSWYDQTDETITITINPAPVTGPIYKISNMWAN